MSTTAVLTQQRPDHPARASVQVPPAPPEATAGALVAGAVVAPDSGEPASTLTASVAAGLVLMVAPSTGRFRPLVEAGLVTAGTVVGVVTGGRGRTDEVRAAVATQVRALLAREGQLVQSGQALAWGQAAA